MSAASGKGNRPIFILLGIVAWVGIIAGSMVVAARIGVRGAPSEASSPSLPPAAAPSDPEELVRALSRADSPVRVEPVPGHPGQFQVTRKETGETVVLDLQALRKLTASGGKVDQAGMARLFPRRPTALPGEEAAPLPEWVPLPPGATVTAHAAASADGNAGTFIVSAAQSLSQTGRFYENRLSGEGYAVTQNEIVGGASAGTVFTATLDGPEALRRTLQLILTRDGARTQVVGTYGTGAGAAP